MLADEEREARRVHEAQVGEVEDEARRAALVPPQLAGQLGGGEEVELAVAADDAVAVAALGVYVEMMSFATRHP